MKHQNKKKKHYKKYRKEYYASNPDKMEVWRRNFIKRWERENGRSHSEYVAEMAKERSSKAELIKNAIRSTGRNIGKPTSLK